MSGDPTAHAERRWNEALSDVELFAPLVSCDVVVKCGERNRNRNDQHE
jgi:hypothetical protein